MKSYAVIEMEKLNLSYDQKDLLKVISSSLVVLYKVTKPYDYRHIYNHSVTAAHYYKRYVFDYTVYQIVMMPTSCMIEMLLDSDDAPYIIESGESLNITVESNLMAITNPATPGGDDIRIYVFGRK